jgi:hypothetical protein
VHFSLDFDVLFGVLFVGVTLTVVVFVDVHFFVDVLRVEDFLVEDVFTEDVFVVFGGACVDVLHGVSGGQCHPLQIDVELLVEVLIVDDDFDGVGVGVDEICELDDGVGVGVNETSELDESTGGAHGSVDSRFFAT